MGGLSKKAYQLEKLRASELLPYLTIDAGGLLFKNEKIAASSRDRAEVTAEGMVQAYNAMGYDAVGVARQDLAAGLSFMKNLQEKSTFSWLSANIVHKSTRQPVFKPYVRRQVGGLAAGITAITGADAPLSSLQNVSADILPWQEILPSLVADLRHDNDIIILLSNYGLRQNEAIARAVQGIHIIIQSGTHATNIAPKLVGNTLICQTGKQGKYLGWLKIDWHKSGTWEKEDPSTVLKAKTNELDRVDRKLARYRQRFPAEQLQAITSYLNFVKNRTNLVGEIAELENKNAKSFAENSSSTFINRFLAMEVALPDNPEVLKLVEGIKKKINTLGRKKEVIKSSDPQ